MPLAVDKLWSLTRSRLLSWGKPAGFPTTVCIWIKIAVVNYKGSLLCVEESIVTAFCGICKLKTWYFLFEHFLQFLYLMSKPYFLRDTYTSNDIVSSWKLVLQCFVNLLNTRIWSFTLLLNMSVSLWSPSFIQSLQRDFNIPVIILIFVDQVASFQTCLNLILF